ncbi:hypothetical protein AAFP30_13380 [Gordonia sp. CPCC 205515]|uniref:hypothetical protein n=1 Tax=Gordonia sp. CPCC 205515 TaxID=3140791 RepID=UPI003AF35729
MPFSDDDLDAFYRDVEAATAAKPVRRAKSKPKTTARGCPTPEKDAFAAEMLARDGIDRIRARTVGGVRLWTYRCVCGSWHITSKPPR